MQKPVKKTFGGPTTTDEIMNTFINKFAKFLDENHVVLEGKVNFMFEVADINNNVQEIRFNIIAPSGEGSIKPNN